MIVDLAKTALQFLTPRKILGGAEEKQEGCTDAGGAALSKVGSLKALSARDTAVLAGATRIRNGLLERGRAGGWAG